MGHRDIRVTQKYVHPSQSRQDAAMKLYEETLARRSAAEKLV
jgi:hypothetical protein